LKPLLSSELSERAKAVKLFVLDVDGVLTDGKIILNDDGVESKNFNVRDGMAIAIAIRKGYEFAIISGRYSKVVERRAAELGIREVFQNAGDKLKVFHTVLAKFELHAEEAAFMGDDINDLPILRECGFSSSPSDADEHVVEEVRFVSSKAGGEGAVRELVELVLEAQKNWGFEA
jgi:3-deoxy-D-manno-octulosonate 8-phosphate phosphatase (KDO 8-P phosphatase)